MKFVSISSLQKTTKPMVENEIVCVLKNNEPAFYTISKEKYESMLDTNNDEATMLSEFTRRISSSLTKYEIESLLESESLSKEAFKRIVLDIAINYVNISSDQELIESLGV